MRQRLRWGCSKSKSRIPPCWKPICARWLPDASRDGDVWIENIPYNETRDYVQRVLWHAVVYAWRRSGAPQAAGALLAPVANLPPVAAPQVAPTPPAPGAPAPTPAPAPTVK